MTAILSRSEYRNTNNTATVVLEKYFNKFSAAFWRIIVKYDCGRVWVINEDLTNKPTSKRISRICESF